MKTNKLYIILGSTFALVAAAVAGFFLFSDRSVSEALAMQQQLTSAEAPAPSIHRRLTQDLTRLVDKMDRDQLRELGEQVREQSREVFNQNLAEYLETPPDQRDAVLDRHLAVSQQWADVYEALRTDAFRGRRGGNRGQRNRQPQGNRQAQAGANNNGNNGNRQRSNDQRPANAQRDPNRDANRDATQNAQREQFAEYWQALRDRAEERGIEFRNAFGRRGRRGRTG